jgi:cytochrome P450
MRCLEPHQPHLPLLLPLPVLSLQIVNERFWLPGWQILELLNGTGSTLRSNVATIKAFALDIVQQRRKQLAAAAGAVAGSKCRDQGLPAQPIRSAGSPEDTSDVAADNSTPAAAAAAAAAAAGGGGGGVTELGVDAEGAKDLLSLFMEVPGPDGKPLNTQQLIDTVINFIIAGRDTTAQVGAARSSLYLRL